ncbi:MAG: hypothetical protein LBL17_00660 [Coxiellaceae bacterium]|nr:hypothetical protein [Coxiellaceae bacterium]
MFFNLSTHFEDGFVLVTVIIFSLIMSLLAISIINIDVFDDRARGGLSGDSNGRVSWSAKCFATISDFNSYPNKPRIIPGRQSFLIIK